MEKWRERLEKEFSEQRFRQQQAEIARREQETQIEAERQKWQRDNNLRLKEAARLVLELHVRQYLEIARREAWQGFGSITEIGGGDHDSWIGLRLAYRYPPEKSISSGYASPNSGIWVPTRSHTIILQTETFTEVVIHPYPYSNTVDIRDGDKYFVGFDEKKPLKENNTFIANKHRIPISEARPELVEETLLQFNVDRIKSNRLPRRLKQ